MNGMHALQTVAAVAPADERNSWRARGDIGGPAAACTEAQNWGRRRRLRPYRMVGYASSKPADALVMAALCNRGALYFCLVVSFYLSSIYRLSFFPRLISVATDWMSTILLHMAWP